jgi:hypothetical protein
MTSIIERFKKYKMYILGFLFLILLVLISSFYLGGKGNIAEFSREYREKSTDKITTVSESAAVSFEEDLQKTYEGDRDFAAALNEHVTNNPWYSEIPIEKEEYVIVYDFEHVSFRIRLKGQESSYTDEMKDLYTESALKDIENLGISGFDHYIKYTP